MCQNSNLLSLFKIAFLHYQTNFSSSAATQSLLRKVAQASTHQASGEFKDPGRQCILFNSIASFTFTEDKNVLTWLPKDLDQLLKHGDWLSVNNGRRVECPLISEIPNAVWLNERQYEIKIGSSECSSFESADFPFDVHRLEHLLKKYKYFIITIGNSTPAYSCAIIVGENEFSYVFDPHSRNKKGLADPCGRATLTTHPKDQLENFFKNFAKPLSASVFEITSVALAPIPNASSLEETFAPSDATDILTCFESDSSSSEDIPLSRYTFLSE
ncbi:herpesvirus tegument, n-terminal conserved region domain-containing protein [Plakobranchus ocellatus]|uniref:Herpesvirus tegument, n-terminal conserved region domain-containing protein n=1 Tax=Plakobranchus ocellatus TaxID=259542 RepID=A0AAV4AQX0_9GAST|nr:herpesvirus tegument, n-terminal conserved region domain-containing protein [Plakobranchus ocellatus]